jgi:hypothetical protein
MHGVVQADGAGGFGRDARVSGGASEMVAQAAGD